MTVASTAPAPSAPVVSPSRRQRVIAVAASAEELDEVVRPLRGLSLAGHQVVLMWRSGEPGSRFEKFGARVRIDPSPRGVRARARSVLTVPARLRAGRTGPLLADLHRDPRAVRALEAADLVVVAGAAATAAAEALTTPARPLVSAAELADWSAVGGVWRKLAVRTAEGPTGLTPAYVRSLVRHLERYVRPVPPRRQESLVPAIEAMHLAGRYDLAHELSHHLDPATPDLDPLVRARLRGLKALTATSATGEPHPELPEVARELTEAADVALREGQVEQAADLAHLALALLFHRELHADKLSSPLVTDPEGFLEHWRASEVGALLGSAAPRRPVLPARSGRTPDAGARRVVVVPGSYPQFSAPVIDALAEQADVRVVDLAARSSLRGLGPYRPLVGARLQQALGDPAVPDYEILEEMEAADAVFVDWADRGGLATVMAVPEGVRLVLRIHSMDALSPWIHLLDWSRVDDLVVVSEPMRRLVASLLGPALSATRVHVVPNVVDLSRLPSSHRAEGRLRRLLMVGWGQQVKDARWALDVLGALRREDPSWRLSLLGTDFPDDAVRSQHDYARAFRARLTQDDVRGAVDFVGYTRDVAPHLAASGFVLSTSRRESFGLGLVEAAASGVVPVVRNWPIYAPLEAARTLFPGSWVVDTVEEAVERIRSTASSEEDWVRASREARDVVAERFSSGDAREAFRRLVLGEV